MKRLGVLAAASLLTVSAMAADNTISATARMSLQSVSNDRTATGIENQSVIAAEYAKVFFGGTLNPSTKYYMTWNLTQGSITDGTDHKDATNKFVENIGIVRTFSEGLTLNLGKQQIIAGGMELTHSTADQYIQSNFSTTGNALVRQFGANVGYTVADQAFNLQLTNGNAEARGAKGQSKYGYAATWAGNFGMIKSKVGYSVRPSGVATSGDVSLLGAGLQFNLSQFVVEADYGVVTTKKGSTNTADMVSNSIAATASYTGHDLLTPFAKFVSDTNKTNDDGSKNNTVTGFGLGVEYKEAKADAVRYHVVYSSAETKYETAAMATTAGLVSGTKKTVGTILVGAKFSTSLL